MEHLVMPIFASIVTLLIIGYIIGYRLGYKDAFREARILFKGTTKKDKE